MPHFPEALWGKSLPMSAKSRKYSSTRPKPSEKTSEMGSALECGHFSTRKGTGPDFESRRLIDLGEDLLYIHCLKKPLKANHIKEKKHD